MPEIKKLISAVETYPNICNIKTYKFEKFSRIWARVADRCQMNDGLEAYNIWSKLLEDYLNFLRNGGEYKYSKEMRFMQVHLVDTFSDSSDIDEAILLEAINHSDDEIDSDIEMKAAKKPKIDEAVKVVKEKTIKVVKEKEKEKVVEVPKQNQTPIESVIPSTNVTGLTSLQLIFLGYAKILQDLPVSLQLRTKHKIAQIMNEAELSLIETNDSSGDKK